MTIQHLAPGLRHRRGHHRLSLWQASVGPKAHRSASEEFFKASQQEISLLQGGMCSKIYTYILDICYLSIWYVILFDMLFYSDLFTYFLIYLCILFTQMISSYTIMCQHLCTHKTLSEKKKNASISRRHPVCRGSLGPNSGKVDGSKVYVAIFWGMNIHEYQQTCGVKTKVRFQALSEDGKTAIRLFCITSIDTVCNIL